MHTLAVSSASTISGEFYSGAVQSHRDVYQSHPKLHPPHIINNNKYSHHISGAMDDHASHVDADGRILNTKGGVKYGPQVGRIMNFCVPARPAQEGQTQYRTLEAKDPEMKTVVLIYDIAFEQEDVNTQIRIFGY